ATRWAARSGAWWRSALAGLPVVFGHPRRRSLALMAWMLGIFVLPEALAAAYAVAIGAGPAATGLLMAADP
ncbi:MFS transporter, partial [Pseudonocardia sp. SID8383]|nr:MFS transporter [Pseudonocardia sp. SID8383]